MKRSTRESDPLPFIQVDRSVTARAALLAQHLGTTAQHAKGSLVDFWELCGEPRELERILGATPQGEEPAVLLDADDVALRFQLASGHRVEPIVLARLGFLEPQADGRFRVRGMSRQFDAMTARINKREAGRAGGRASAASREAALGTSQPPASAGASTMLQPVRSTPEAPPKQSRSVVEAASNTEDRGQRTERGSTSSPLEQPRAGGPEEGPARWLKEGEAFVAWASRQAPELATPGHAVFQWSDDWHIKHQPSSRDILREAFASFLVWCSLDKKAPGWGLWLRPSVWEPRVAAAREATAAGRLGAA